MEVPPEIIIEPYNDFLVSIGDSLIELKTISETPGKSFPPNYGLKSNSAASNLSLPIFMQVPSGNLTSLS